MRRRVLSIAVTLLSALVAGGCATLRPVAAPVAVPVAVEAAPALNRDDQGRSLSVVLRVYQLREAERFGRAPFAALMRRDQEMLAGDVVSREERIVAPGAGVERASLALGPETRFIAFVALFRQPDRRHWRQVFPVDGGAVALRLEECAIRVLAGRALALDGVAAEAAAFDCPRGPR